jgi:CAAX protease family protein
MGTEPARQNGDGAAPMATLTPTASPTVWRWIELGLLFGLGPALLALGPRWMVSLGILGIGALCVVVLVLDSTFPRRDLWQAARARDGLPSVLARTLLVWAGILGLTLATSSQPLFALPRSRPTVWIAIMVLYPISAYAQEVAYRTFFFHRYARLFRGRVARVCASGVLFGWAHVAVNNLAAVLLATVAGLLFAWTYERWRSTLLVSLEHALYGDFVFTVGLGHLFYSTARWVATGAPAS